MGVTAAHDMRTHLLRFISISFLALALGAQAQSRFTPGNLAILRAGDGIQVLTNTGNTLFLDQYTTNGTVVNTTTIPDSGASALILSGVAGSEGGLTLSANKASLALIGYNTNRTAGVKLASSAAAAVPRGIGTIDPAGTFTLAQTNMTAFDGNNPRCVVSDGVGDFWAAGGTDGTVYFNPPNTSTTIQSSVANTRYIKIVSSNLYFSVQSGTAGIYTLNNTSGGAAGLTRTTAVANAFFTTGSGSQPSAFEINPDLTVAYVADQRTSTGGGIQKWTKSGSTWSLAYTLLIGTGLGAFGVAVDFTQTHPVIYATTAEAVSSNRLVRIIDNGASSAATLLAKAGNNRSFRGVDFTPDGRPIILTQPQGQTVSAGSDVTMSINISSVYALSYQWQKNGMAIPGATNAALSLHNVSTADQATYSVALSNQFGQVTSAGAALFVKVVTGPPTISAPPQNQTNFVGETTTFSVTALGAPPLGYQWFFNSNSIAGATNSSLVLSNLDLTNQGYYSVSITSPNGSTNSQNAFLAVMAVPPSISTQPVSQIARINSTVTLLVNVTGTGPFTWQWSFNGAPLSESSTFIGTASNLLTITDVQFGNAGQYSVAIIGLGGATNSQPATLTVVPEPSAVIYTNAGSIYVQDFNSLPNPGTNTVNTDDPVTVNNVTYSLNNPFDLAFPVQATGAGGLGLSNTLSGWYGLGEIASKFGASAGDQSTGGLISFGPTNSAATNRALGLLATSSTGPTAFSLKLINGSSMTLTQMNLSFVGQLWRQQPTAKTLVFGYRVDAATNDFSTNVTEWVPALNVSFATNASASGVNGPLATAQLSISQQRIADWAPGAALWLIWQMPDASGSGQGLAIDDLNFSATGAPVTVNLSVALSGNSVMISWPVSASGFVLEFNNDLSNTTGWSAVALPSVGSGDMNTVQVPATGTAQFFRLKRN